MAYKSVPRETTLSAAVADAYSEISTLADEMRSWHDSIPENMQGSDKATTVESTAEGLENHSSGDPDVPEAIGERAVKYHESVNKDKRNGPSRAVRCENAVALLNSALEGIAAWQEETKDFAGDNLAEAVQELKDAVEETLNEIDGLEFPSMFG